MLGAGLLARKARARGITSKPWVKTSLAPGSRVVTDYFTKAGVLDDLAQIGFDLVGYGCTTCIAAGTPVLMANGTSRRIEQLPQGGGAAVFAPDAQRRLARAVQTEMMVRGERECVSLVLQDGRTLVCTPEHEILRADGRWVRADALKPGEDRVVMGLEAPLDEVGEDECGYRLRAGEFEFTLDDSESRQRALAFARLLGHLLSDGSISRAGQGRMNLGQALDREAALSDVELLTGKRPLANAYDERKWSIVLPQELTSAIIGLPGVRTGRRIDQAPTLPQFVVADQCPVALVREFLGGLFGGDGHAPHLRRYGRELSAATLARPAYAQSAKPEFVEATKALMQEIVRLLVRCGVKARGATVRDYPTRQSASSYSKAQDGIPRQEIRLELPEGLSFVERVGFRYSTDKMLRASAAAVYWRMVDTINRQRLWMADRLEELHQSDESLTFTKARALAAVERTEQEAALSPRHSLLARFDCFSNLRKAKARPFRLLHRDSDDFPSPAELFEQMGVSAWFTAPDSVDAVEDPKRYCTTKDAMALPTFTLAVTERRAAGKRPVFDLSVSELHAFVAAGVSVHNCIGNSGPLKPEISAAVKAGDLTACAVLSGNRNFEGRVHPEVRMNFLASPPLVVAYALAGTLDIDLTTEPIGKDQDGKDVFLADIWPSDQEVQELLKRSIDSQMFRDSYASVFKGDDNWTGIQVPAGKLYSWDANSTYVKDPPYFEGMTMTPPALSDVKNARALAVLGDSVTTDHISPAGNISKSSPAARYLIEQGVDPKDFNSYGARRGNHEVMMRGTFANIRLRNLMVPGAEGGVSVHLPDGTQGPSTTPPCATRAKARH